MKPMLMTCHPQSPELVTVPPPPGQVYASCPLSEDPSAGRGVWATGLLGGLASGVSWGLPRCGGPASSDAGPGEPGAASGARGPLPSGSRPDAHLPARPSSCPSPGTVIPSLTPSVDHCPLCWGSLRDPPLGPAAPESPLRGPQRCWSASLPAATRHSAIQGGYHGQVCCRARKCSRHN